MPAPNDSKRTSLRPHVVLASVLAAVSVAWSTTASAATYSWVEWTTANVGAGTASGTISLGDSTVSVTFAATFPEGGAGNLYNAQTNGLGTNFWLPLTTFQSAAVENAPSRPDILQLSGGQGQVYTVTLSEPVVNPIMSIISLGQGASPITYDFSSPFTIVSQGPSAAWGGSTTSLTQLPDNVLQGAEGSGVIQFIGTFSTFSWTVPNPETWHGFTFGILTSRALYDGGGPDGSTDVITGDAGVEDSEDAGGVDASTAPPDAASPDAGIRPDATPEPFDGGQPPPLSTPPPAESGCGCVTVGGRDVTGLFPLAGLIAAATVIGRRARRRR